MLATLHRIVERLSDVLGAFVRRDGPRVLHVAVGADLRRTALGLITDHELHPDNTRGFVLLDAACFDRDPGWGQRITQLRESHERRQRALERQGEAAPDLGERPDAGLSDDSPPERWLAAFGAQLAQLREVQVEPITGWVIVMAPSPLESPRKLRDDLLTLWNSERLRELRWIVVETDAVELRPKQAEYDGVVYHDARADAAALNAEVERMMAQAAAAPDGATSFALIGAAWPSEAPPRRKEQSFVDEGVRGEVGRAAQGEDVLDVDRALQLRDAVYRASVGARDELRKAEVLEAQRAAVGICVGAGWERQAAICETVLGGYHLRYRESDEALRIYRDAASRAERAEAWDVAISADLARAAILRSRSSDDEALRVLLASVQGPRSGASLLLRMEAWRQAAELALALGMTEVARRAVEEAVAAARRGDGPEVNRSCAGEVARAGGKLLRQQGKHAEAGELMDLADAFETGSPPWPPAAQAAKRS